MSKLPSSHAGINREDMYLDGLAFGKVIMDDEIEHHHGVFEYYDHRYILVISSPFGHNPTMFGNALKLQTSPEQRAKWLPLQESGKIIGTYVQTELGHGTFLRGLETTATLDLERDEFVVHSPTLTSTKYWPSALAFSATHAVVMANLIIRGKNHGMQPFMVQLRSLDDHSPMPGIETGDVGSKMGLNSTDMGFARFDNIRIPRTNLLMGNVKVLQDGTFTEGMHQKLTYLTMLYTRDRIIHCMAYNLAQAVVIASRYSVVREQGIGVSPSATAEWPILTYKSQHYRLLSIMSQAYALFFAAEECTKIYTAFAAEQALDDLSSLPFLHATIAALKAYHTQVALDGAEDARKCCGGYGYSVLSGLPSIVGALAPMPTLEGENHVMYQQTARYLMKAITRMKQGLEVDEGVAYLAAGHKHLASSTIPGIRCPGKKPDFLTQEMQVEIIRHRATRLTFHAHHLLTTAQSKEGGNLQYADAWNKHILPLVYAARAHIELFVLEAFNTHISPQSCPDPSIRGVLSTLRSLFALTAISNPVFPGSQGFIEAGYISYARLEIIRALVDELLQRLIPEIIALGDAWNFSDASLASALGCKDGDVYTRLMSWTRQLPMNVKGREDGGVQRKGYERVIGPMLKGRL